MFTYSMFSLQCSKKDIKAHLKQAPAFFSTNWLSKYVHAFFWSVFGIADDCSSMIVLSMPFCQTERGHFFNVLMEAVWREKNDILFTIAFKQHLGLEMKQVRLSWGTKDRGRDLLLA